MKKLAYSYVRFSSSKQASGDSLRRQHDKAAKYASANGLTLDESLTYRDLGVSAYDASNVKKGALGLFLQALRAGRVPQGSYLLVEQMDRLSRDSVLPAMDVLREIVDAGVSVVTLSDERVLTKENVGDLGNLMLTIAVLYRAHEESERKGELIGSYWANRRNLRPPVFTKECPRWLEVNSDKTGYKVINDRVESILKVFQLTAGGYGNVHITRKANAEKWPVPGNCETWHCTLITRLLNNRAVIGEHQPYTIKAGKQKLKKRIPDGEPWSDYYPKIIDESLFNLARAAKATRSQLPRRRDARYLNIFQGVLKCSCGSSFSRKYKGSQAQPGYVQYQCTDRIRGVTKCPSISALKLHPGLLRGIYEAGFVSVAHDDFTTWARDEVASAETSLKDERQRLSNLIKALESAEDSIAILMRVKELEKSVKEKSAHLVERNEWLSSLSDNLDITSLEGDLQGALSKLTGDEHIEFRAGLHERITRVVKTISITPATMTAHIAWRAPRPNTVIQLI